MSILLASLVVLLAIIGAVLVLTRPVWAFLPVVMMFAMEQLFQSYFVVLQTHQSAFNLGVIGLASMAAFLRISRRDPVFVGMRGRVTILIYLQFILWLVSMVYSNEVAPPGASLQASWYYVLLLLVVLPLLVTGLAEVRQLLIGMMLVGTIMAVLILLNPNTSYYTGRLVLDLGMMNRQVDTVGNPLATAAMGGTIALIAALIVPKRANPAMTTLRIAAFILGFGLAIGSGSRGQVLATVIAGVLFFPIARRLNNPRNFILSTAGLIILALGIYATFQLFIGEQNRQRWDPLRMVNDITMRFDMCVAYLDAWISSPAHWLFGLGANAWMGVGSSAFQSDYVHNIAIEILCEQGIVGAAVFVLTTYLVIQGGIQMWRIHRNDPSLRSVAAIFLAICAFELFNSLKQGSIAGIAPFYWWLVLGKVAFYEQQVALENTDAIDDEASDIELVDTSRQYILAP